MGSASMNPSSFMQNVDLNKQTKMILVNKAISPGQFASDRFSKFNLNEWRKNGVQHCTSYFLFLLLNANNAKCVGRRGTKLTSSILHVESRSVQRAVTHNNAAWGTFSGQVWAVRPACMYTEGRRATERSYMKSKRQVRRCMGNHDHWISIDPTQQLQKQQFAFSAFFHVRFRTTQKKKHTT